MAKLKPIGKILVVPGGSHWSCTQCGRELLPGEKVVRIGGKKYCTECVQKEGEGGQ